MTAPRCSSHWRHASREDDHLHVEARLTRVCFVILRVHSWSTAAEAMVTANAAAAKALDIDDTLAEAHATLGVIRLYSEWNWPGAEQSFCRAIELAPDYATAHNWYANYLAAQHRLDAAYQRSAGGGGARSAQRHLAHGRRSYAVPRAPVRRSGPD